MNQWRKYFFSVSFCIAFFLIGRAQDLDSISSVILQDTVYPSTVSPNESYQFKEPSFENKTNRKISDAELNKVKADDDYWYINQTPPRAKEKLPPDHDEKTKKEIIF